MQGLGQPGLTRTQVGALALTREDRQVSKRDAAPARADSRDATQALTDLVNRGLAYRVGGRRYAEYLLDEDHRPDGPGLFDDVRPESGATTPEVGRQRYDRSEQVKALFAEGRTLTASQVAGATGLGLAMTNRYLARVLAAGELIATAPPGSTKRAYRATT